MPLKKFLLKAGVNKENTRYTTEGGWYDCDKIRFRQGTPEKIGGWNRLSATTFLGVCRSLWNWVTLAGRSLIGVGTNKKFYIEYAGGYNDITPNRYVSSAGSTTFAATNGSSTITVTDYINGARAGDFVTFVNALSLGGNVTAFVLNREYEIQSVTTASTYTITVSVTASASDTGDGGSSAYAEYQIHLGPEINPTLTGWGAGGWGSGPWGGSPSPDLYLRLWSQSNFGQDLVFGPRDGGIYYWDAALGLDVRAVNLADKDGASEVPIIQKYTLISDANRFVFAFGCNDIASIVQDPMLIRWSDQENATEWMPSATNQAGGLRLSHGSQIITAMQSRQEILVWTDSTLYGLQYVGAPVVWSSSLLGDNLSIISQNATAYANGVAFWMGVDKFYKYDGRVQTLRCDLRQYIYSDINRGQFQQVYAGTNEGFNEVWWFYCSANSTVIDKYVVYNYAEDIWYYGTMGRTAWLDSGLRDYPLAATYSNNLVNHEYGVDDGVTGTLQPITAYISSSEFDLDDGHQFMFVWRMLPDITFRGSQTENPAVTMYLLPLKNSGSGYVNNTSVTANQSVGYFSSASVTRTAVVPVEQYTGQVYTRVRGRQLAIRVESTGLGVNWQLGAPRLDCRPDGRR